ncbi:MAG: Uma2 family endonuclease [Nostocaceae cyanobacterium]|nr:Uma2 family endonuclease [Nostocaceae cyanobacterium]
MTIVQSQIADTVPLNLSTLKLTQEQFYDLCVANPEQPLELTRAGALIIMSPVGGESGRRELNLGSQLYAWNEISSLGEVFSSSTIFKLPLGSQRSPDAAWVELSRWKAISVEEREKFPPLAPDFVIELRSRTDSLSDLQDKMLEYRDNGVRLGLLINPQDKQVEVYQLGKEVEVIQSPDRVSCEDVLPGFNLDLTRIFS